MTSPLQFKRAVRHQAPLKILVTGASGSGKTLGALKLAESLHPDAIAVIDSENSRSSFYADVVEFDVLTLPDALPGTLRAALQLAVDHGAKVVIVDSLSHCWQDILDRKTAFDQANPRGNSFAHWKKFSAEWESLIRFILELPVHVICTARSKQAYEQVQEEGGKKRVVKLGLQPILRDGTEYEFALHFNLNESHKVAVEKDNTRRFGGEGLTWDLCDGSIAHELRQWLSTATPVARPTPETCAAMDEAIAGLPDKKQAEARRRWAIRRDQGVTEEEAQEMLAKLLPHASDVELEAAKRKIEHAQAESPVPGGSGGSPADEERDEMPDAEPEDDASPDGPTPVQLAQLDELLDSSVWSDAEREAIAERLPAASRQEVAELLREVRKDFERRMNERIQAPTPGARKAKGKVSA